MADSSSHFLDPAELAIGDGGTFAGLIRSNRIPIAWNKQYESENIRYGFLQVTESGLAFLSVLNEHDDINRPEPTVKQLKLELLIKFAKMRSIKEEMESRMRIFIKDGPNQVVYFDQAAGRSDFEYFVLEKRLMSWVRRNSCPKPTSYTPVQAIYKLVPCEEE